MAFLLQGHSPYKPGHSILLTFVIVICSCGARTNGAKEIGRGLGTLMHKSAPDSDEYSLISGV